MTINRKIEYISKLGLYDYTLSTHIISNIKDIPFSTHVKWTTRELSKEIILHMNVRTKADMKFWNNIFVILRLFDKHHIEAPYKIRDIIDALLNKNK